MELGAYDARPFRSRREKLAGKLNGARALIASGAPSPRNYPANTFPYRAASHFLYFFGLPLREAFAFFDGRNWSLFVNEPAPANALWHGPEPTLAELAQAFAVPVLPMEKLPSLTGDSAGVMTMAAADQKTCLQQARLVERELACGLVGEIDRPLADAVVALRLVHDGPAIAELRAASVATAAAHAAGMRATRAGVPESVIRAAMEAEITGRDLGCAYGSIVTVHGEVLHNEAHHHILRDGDLLLADVGAESAGGFAGDVTRTWPVSGKYSPAQRDLYQVVLDTQKDTISRVKPGVNYRDLHVNAMERIGAGLVDLGILKGQLCDLIEHGAVALFFPHGVGHLLGLDVHDMEDLGDRAGYSPGRQRSKNFGLKSLRLDRILEPGMAVTIEPGFYQVPAILQHPELGRDPAVAAQVNWDRLAQFSDVRGIRIEDDVLVTTGGHEVLTAAIPKEIAEVEQAVGGR